MKFVSNKNQQSGFTLIESMVAIAIFTIVMVIGISALLNVNNTNKKSQNLRTIIDSLNFTMEDMARNFKLGSYYHCVGPADPGIAVGTVNDFLADPEDCGTGTHSGYLAAALESMNGRPTDPATTLAHADDQVVYMFEVMPGVVNPNSPDPVCTLKKSTNGGRDFATILPPEVHIDCSQSGFNVYNTKNDRFTAAPRVLIRIGGIVVYKDVTTPFTLQTSASQRNIDIVSP